MIQQAHLYVSWTRILHFIQINVTNPTLVPKMRSKTKKTAKNLSVWSATQEQEYKQGSYMLLVLHG